ncbi:hypothetical protein OAT16_08215 [Prolixibacteraceae bacterium]|nr:hypothetical protein [Prolixibacteraceae bacterium]
MKRVILLIWIYISILTYSNGQVQESFWYKDSKYTNYEDNEIEVMCYVNKIRGASRSALVFHFNFYNNTDNKIILKSSDIWIYEGAGKRIEENENRKWKLIELKTSLDYYRFHYGPKSNYKYTNDDLSTHHDLYTHYATKQVNDSIKKQVLVEEYIAKNSPSEYELRNKLHMSTRYIGKTTLTRYRHASGVLRSSHNYREVPEQLKIVLKIGGTTQKTIYINQN